MTHKFSPITLGEQLKKVEVGGFVLTETTHPPGLTLRRHEHERASISFVLKGSYIEVVGSRSQECVPLSLLMKPAGEAHSNKYGSSGARALIIEVKPQRLKAIRSYSETLEHTEYVQGGLLPALAMRVYKEFKMRDQASALIIEGLILEMLGYRTRRDAQPSPFAPPPWLRRARDLCHEQFAQPTTLISIAEAVGVHPSHLARIFRRHYHCTVGDYVRRLRLDYALRELAHSERSLTEIASAAGFYDHSHFTHIFTLQMGMTPTAYRAAIRGRK
jgi:AraC family transcriptional regulator